MSHITYRPLDHDIPFGMRLSGVTPAALESAELRTELRNVFQRCGLMVFEDVEPTDTMQIELSKVFGPLKEHPIPTVPRAGIKDHPGIIAIEHDPDDPNILHVNGRDLSQWLPWHFDHCYNDKLNRAGVLRAITIAPEGGLTGFLDGIDLYNSAEPELRTVLERLNIIYILDPLLKQYRFGLPDDFRAVRLQRVRHATAEYVKDSPRAVHPAVWRRETGEKVLHMAPFMSLGIQGQETAEGYRQFQELCDEAFQAARPYFHQWKLTDMLIWDNWRMLHSATGIDPTHRRRMHRTTIEGDYGLGRFEPKPGGEVAA